MRVFVVAAVTLLAPPVFAKTITVGPNGMYPKPCAAIAAAAMGDRIEIDATGNGSYDGDVCGWKTSSLTIVGVNGRARIDAAGQNSGGKAIWVIGGDDNTVENIELSGATVVDMNGAGIRQEGHNLTVRGCYFHDNEDGILAGDLPGSSILIEYSEFYNNGAGDGQSHNLYINHVDQLTFRYNFSHHAKVGHLLKSRALKNFVLYNRFSDEADGTSSYEVTMPNAGTSYVIGNVIEQGPMTQNSAIIDYGSEMMGFNPTSDLYVVNNSVVNDRPNGGTFVAIGQMVQSPATLVNNIFFGPGTITNQGNAVQANNYSGATPMFVDVANYDYHLKNGSPCVDMGKDPGMANGMSLTPTMEYVHPAGGEGRVTIGTIDIGAFELGGAVPGDGGMAGVPDMAMGKSGDGGTIVHDLAMSASNSDGGGGGTTGGGCGCVIGARAPSGIWGMAGVALILFVAFRRGRRAARGDRS
jgi:hypothetical protein